MPPVFRFAPSPNGYLHLGHALSALLNAEMARAAGGQLLLRIEDIDETRCRPEFEAAIYEDLAWLGLRWGQPGRRQAEHYNYSRTALGNLESLSLAYPSFESRAEIARLVAAREPWPRDPDGAPLYPGDAKSMTPAERVRRMRAAEPYALRLDMQAALARGGPPRPARSQLTPPPGVTWSWRARKCRPAITWRWWWTMPSKALPMWCGAATYSRGPASTGCCRHCSAL